MSLLRDLRTLVVRPSLMAINQYSLSAEVLVAGTPLIETDLDYLKQITGPALGLWQIEPRTHKDVKIWLRNGFNKGLMELVLLGSGMQTLPDDQALIYNLNYAAMICRIIYYRAKPPLPRYDDAQGMANYHKQFYNSEKGKAEADKNVSIFEKVIHDVQSER